jgi:hypothetical protein
MTSRAVFSGYDASGYINLWVTDGTAAGTSEPTPAGAYHYWLLDVDGGPDFTDLDGRILFEGVDASNGYKLWVTDGTSDGTSELPVGLLTPSASAPDFTVIGSKALFAGAGPGNRSDLWVTDGTASGTSDLTPAFPTEPLPSDLTVLDDKALFSGPDSLGRVDENGDRIDGLYVTDGTSAGTAGLVNASNPIDITSIGGKAVFAGATLTPIIITYVVNTPGLFVTDGTSAGTRELTVSGAYSGGLFFGMNGEHIYNHTDDPDFTALGSELLFVGVDTSGRRGLWVTDGTSAGTSELTAGASSGGLFSNLPNDQQPEFTVIGAKAVFLGTDASGNPNLWVTDGTSAGTSELTVAGADSRGLFFEIDPQFCALGDKVLFVGADPTGRRNLWITDGTSAGTHELVIAGIPELDPRDFAVVGNKVLFEGVDQSGHNVLWITDGTAAGTSEVAVPGAYTGGSGLTPTDITAILPPPAPITIATNGTTSLVQIGSQYELEAVGSGMGPVLTYGGSVVSVGQFPGWTPVGAEKTASGYEVAWSLLGSNEYMVWNTDGDGAYTGAATGALSGASYALQHLEPSFGEDLNGDGTIGPTSTKPPATSDFNKDGFSDILWQNTDGQASIWDMNGNTLIGGGAVSPNPGPKWHAIGTGDFDHDGHSDILWQNVSGQASIWEMNGNTLKGGGPVSPNPGPSWRAVGTGDFNGDGDSDILWQNANGQVSIWDMNGDSLIGGGPVSPNPGPAWKAIGTGDFNGDGLSDILFQNTSSGQVSIWDMNGNKLIGGGPVSPNPGPAWKAIGTGDFNSDGLPDILFQNTSTGQASIWDMSGTSLVGGGPGSPNPGPNWHATA